jgi:hypothetical protein
MGGAGSVPGAEALKGAASYEQLPVLHLDLCRPPVAEIAAKRTCDAPVPDPSRTRHPSRRLVPCPRRRRRRSARSPGLLGGAGRALRSLAAPCARRLRHRRGPRVTRTAGRSPAPAQNPRRRPPIRCPGRGRRAPSPALRGGSRLLTCVNVLSVVPRSCLLVRPEVPAGGVARWLDVTIAAGPARAGRPGRARKWANGLPSGMPPAESRTCYPLVLSVGATAC